MSFQNPTILTTKIHVNLRVTLFIHKFSKFLVVMCNLNVLKIKQKTGDRGGLTIYRPEIKIMTFIYHINRKFL